MAIERIQSFDLETRLIVDGCLAPPIVCGSTATFDSARLLSKHEVFEVARDLLMNDTVMIVGANIAFDMCVLAAAYPELLELIFAKYAKGLVYDVLIAQALDAIANGHLFIDPRTGKQITDDRGRPSKRYSLSICIYLVFGRRDAKRFDRWRTRYAMLENIPIDQWPEDARQYPIDDAVNTLQLAAAQMACWGFSDRTPFRNLSNMPEQAEAAFDMQLGAVWGVRTCPERLNALEGAVEKLHEQYMKRMQPFGFYKTDGSKNTVVIKKAVARAYGVHGVCPLCSGTGKVRSTKTKNMIVCAAKMKGCDGTGLDLSTSDALPRSDGGGVSTSRDTLLESGDDSLMALAENEPEKLRDTYIPYLRQGLTAPINFEPNVLVESGRTSYGGVIQLFPRQPMIEIKEGDE